MMKGDDSTRGIDPAWEYWVPDPEIMEVAFSYECDPFQRMPRPRDDSNIGYSVKHAVRDCRTKLSIDKAMKIARLWKDGISIEEIARTLRIHHQTVSNWRRKCDLPARPVGNHSRSSHKLTPTVAATFGRLWFSGAPLSEIGKALGVSTSVAAGWRVKLRLPPGLQGFCSRGEQAQARRNRAQG